MKLRIEVPGAPRGKGRHRTVRMGKFNREYPDEPTEIYENLIKLAAREAMQAARQPMLLGALSMAITAIFPVPQSWSRKKQALATSGSIRPTIKPDGDNILKVASDGLNGILYADDRAIVDVQVSKVYGVEPKVVVEVSQI